MKPRGILPEPVSARQPLDVLCCLQLRWQNKNLSFQTPLIWYSWAETKVLISPSFVEKQTMLQFILEKRKCHTDVSKSAKSLVFSSDLFYIFLSFQIRLFNFFAYRIIKLRIIKCLFFSIGNRFNSFNTIEYWYWWVPCICIWCVNKDNNTLYYNCLQCNSDESSSVRNFPNYSRKCKRMVSDCDYNRIFWFFFSSQFQNLT